MQASKSSAAAPEPQKVPEPIFWVKCDECDRWRIINGLTHEEQTKLMKKSWFCRMHPDVAQRECDKVVSSAAWPRFVWRLLLTRAGHRRNELGIKGGSSRLFLQTTYSCIYPALRGSDALLLLNAHCAPNVCSCSHNKKTMPFSRTVIKKTEFWFV